MRRLVDRHLAFLHRLEQARLRARCRAVDLVDEEQVRQDRPRSELEALGPLVVDRDAGDVRRDEVGRALDAMERQRERTRDGTREGGLPYTGDVIEKDVALDQQCGE